ncbi:MAG: chromate efflux transporter [Saprospiraceae bacterium]|nr:chromate efflux transporter [Saprospiraceae bacterium]
MNKPLLEVAALFLKLGVTAFGGPAAHIGMMEQEVVQKRDWMTRAHFLDLVGATNLIPGPNSTEMTMHIGYERAGIAGLFVAGLCFILPAALITLIFAYLYVEYGSMPAVEPFFIGIKAVVIAIILQAVYKLGQKALKNWPLGIIGGVLLATSLLGLSEIWAVLAGGVLALGWLYFKRLYQKSAVGFFPILLWQSQAALHSDASLGKLFLVFLKIGAVLFGSGYVLVAYLEDELVTKLGWLTQSELLDAIAIGQFTPGPVLTTATFIGYQIQGWNGAALATLGIFLPSFLFVWLLNPLVSRMRQSKFLAQFLDGVNIGAVAVMLAVTLQLGYDLSGDWRQVVIGLVSIFIVFYFPKLSSFWLILGGALVGWGLGFV